MFFALKAPAFGPKSRLRICFSEKGVTDLGGNPPTPFTDKIRKVVFDGAPNGDKMIVSFNCILLLFFLLLYPLTIANCIRLKWMGATVLHWREANCILPPPIIIA